MKLKLCYVPGAIPMLSQVMSATRVATDAFSGVSRHVNGAVSQIYNFLIVFDPLVELCVFDISQSAYLVFLIF